MQVKLPPFLQRWNFLKTLMISAIIFVIGLFFGFISPKILKTFVTSVSDILKRNIEGALLEMMKFYEFVNFTANPSCTKQRIT